MSVTNFRRLILPILLLALVLMSGLMTACDNGQTPEPETTSAAIEDVTTAPTTTSNEETTAPAESPTEPEASSAEAEDTSTEPNETTEEEVTTEAVTDVMNGEVLDAPLATAFTVSNVFSNDMVVQRGEHIRVWGWADESQNGKKVCGEFKGVTAEALIENGEWVLTFGMRLPASAEMGHSMRIYADGAEYVFENVLVGDVYFVMGQSNTEYNVSTNISVNGGTIDESLPIRLHYDSAGLYDESYYPAAGTAEEAREIVGSSRWELPTAANAGRFSAIGYCFATEMLKASDGTIPVGLIQFSLSGRPLGSFLPNEVAEAFKADKWDDSLGYYVCEALGNHHARYIYNCFINPFEGYAMAGMIWYQGESDCVWNSAKDYNDRFAALVEHLRSQQNLVNRNFPVYVMEFPTIYDGSFDYGMIRSIMGNIPNVVPNSYFIASSDLSTNVTAESHWQLHPHIKHLQAKRLATLVQSLNGLSNKTLDEVSGPRLVSAVWGEDKKTVILTYENVGEGLMTCDGSDIVKGFGLARSNYLLITGKTVEARITAPNQITVTAPISIQAVTYNANASYFYGTTLNLCNSYGQIAPAVSMVVTEAE